MDREEANLDIGKTVVNGPCQLLPLEVLASINTALLEHATVPMTTQLHSDPLHALTFVLERGSSEHGTARDGPAGDR